jgi:hypothetical protein
MYLRYQPYPYYRRYYNIDPYHYRRYYSPYNIYNGQISDVTQSINNFGDMNDVNQNANVYQSMCPEPVAPLTEETVEPIPEPHILPV